MPANRWNLNLAFKGFKVGALFYLENVADHFPSTCLTFIPIKNSTCNEKCVIVLAMKRV